MESTSKHFITHSGVEITRSKALLGAGVPSTLKDGHTQSLLAQGTNRELTEVGGSSFQWEAASLLEVSCYAELKFAFL